LKSYVVFVNPEFTLYQHDPNHPIVHPTEIRRFIHAIKKTPSTLTSYHHHLADKLFTSELPEERVGYLPEYRVDRLKKGVGCVDCSGFLTVQGRTFNCDLCGYKEGLDAGVIRSAIEYHLLFPESQITTKAIWQWCNINRTKETIKKILNKYMVPSGEKRHRHFIFPDSNRMG